MNVRIVRRQFGPGRPAWFSVVATSTDRVLVGAIQSHADAEQWVSDNGHTVVTAASRLAAVVADASTRPQPRPGMVRPAVSKDDAPCCLARRLPDGRPVIGFCSPECVRRPA